jgi:hypothetical protein
MAFLTEKDQQFVQNLFENMQDNVKGVPRTIIYEDYPIEGAVSEMELVEKILEVHNS